MGKPLFQDIVYEKTGHKAQITINRPEVLNAFRERTYEEFCMACADATTDQDIGVLVITGAGKRAFSSGGDVRSYAVQPGEESNMPGVGAIIYETIRKVTKPTIAMVRGWCIGGANVLAAQCTSPSPRKRRCLDTPLPTQQFISNFMQSHCGPLTRHR